MPKPATYCHSIGRKPFILTQSIEISILYYMNLFQSYHLSILAWSSSFFYIWDGCYIEVCMESCIRMWTEAYIRMTVGWYVGVCRELWVPIRDLLKFLFQINGLICQVISTTLLLLCGLANQKDILVHY